MLSMYHGLSRMPQGVPNLFQQGVPSLFRPSLPMWPHAPTHSQMQFTNSTNPYALNLQKPTDDSCGGSSASNASDTNGSGDEVDVEVIDTQKMEIESNNSLKFSIGNLLKSDTKTKPPHMRPTIHGLGNIHQCNSAGMGPMLSQQPQGHFEHSLFTSMIKMQHQQQQIQRIKLENDEEGCTDDSPFKCEICGKCFKHVRMLNRHRRNHSPFKKYKCTFCGKGFNDSFDLKRHVRTHTGVKPYKCDYCEKSFTQRCSLESHQDKIHGLKHKLAYKQRREKIYVCEECGYSTGDVREHYKHARESHKDVQEHLNILKAMQPQMAQMAQAGLML